MFLFVDPGHVTLIRTDLLERATNWSRVTPTDITHADNQGGKLLG